MIIRQHIPTLFYDRASLAEFSSLDQLLRIDWVHLWTLNEGFHQFSLAPIRGSTDELYRSVLLAEFNEGRRTWPVGDTDALKIPGLAHHQ